MHSCTTSSITSTSGNLFIIGVAHYTDGTNSVLSDSKSNSYTTATGAPTTTTDIDGSLIAYKANGTGGASHTFTWTSSDSFFASMSASEISGANTSSPLDQIADANDGTTNHSSGSTPTTTQAKELLLGVGHDFGNGTTHTTDTGAGWIELANITTTGTAIGLITGYQVVSATSTYAYTYTTNVVRNSVQHITTWKEAAAGGTKQKCIGCGIDKKIIGDR